jgi:phospholipase C
MALDHVIVLMLENNSFDRMLGALFAERPGGGGIKGTAANHWNDDETVHPSQRYTLKPTTTREVNQDPGHELTDVLDQLKGPLRGFVTDFAKLYPTTNTPQRQEIMGYYADGMLPNLHKLAKEFTVCDRWFSSMPGPTWPNRIFVHTGTSLGYVTNSTHNVWDQTTVYQLLEAMGISFKVYCGDGDISQTYVLINKPWVDPMRYFYRDARGSAASFPKYCFIEPHYGTIFKSGQNDQHPLSDVFRGEALIADIYNAIRANDALWKSSLLVITYDEHGGFYDHVDPPATVAPDSRTAPNFDFKKLGVRVPTILVSPWLDKGVIIDTFDHTSLLKFIVQKWGLSNSLGDRVAAPSTNTFAKYIRKTPRDTSKVLRKLAVPDVLPPHEEVGLTDHQESLIELGHSLALQVDNPNLRAALLRQPAELTPRNRAMQAVEQFKAFQVEKAKTGDIVAAAVPQAAQKRTKTRRGAKKKKKK